MSGRGAKPWRLFAAAYPPADVAERLLSMLDRLELAEHRRAPVGQVHLTLQFIGDVEPRDLDATIESVERSCAGVGRMSLRPVRLVTMPEHGRPRLIACETDAPPALVEVVRRLARRLARSPRRDAADRFCPHLTLCRFARGARADRATQPIDLEPFPIDEVRLMRSVLRPEGAEHALVRAFPLGSS